MRSRAVPTPDLTRYRAVTVVCAHPDDERLGRDRDRADHEHATETLRLLHDPDAPGPPSPQPLEIDT